MIRELNTQCLRLCGYQVDAVEDGAVAWDALQVNSYDLVVTDNGMPKVSGVELLKKLHAARMEMPVVLVTGTSLEEEFTRSPWLRPAATLAKPYAVADFLDTVKAVLRATKNGCEQIAPPPNGQSRAFPDGLPV